MVISGSAFSALLVFVLSAFTNSSISRASKNDGKGELRLLHHHEHFFREADGVQSYYCSIVHPYITINDAQRITTKKGFKMFISGKNDVVSNSLRKHLIWEREDTAAIMVAINQSLAKKRNSTSAPVFLDIGANLGWYSLAVAHAYPNATVIAFEAMQQNAILLRGSICENLGYERRITLINRALGESAQHCEMVAMKTNTQNGIMKCGKDDKAGVYNPKTFLGMGSTIVMRLDSVIEMDIDMIKLDVEGFEAAVIAGAEGLFSRHRVGFILLEFFETRIVSAGGDPWAMIKRLLEWGFQFSTTGFTGPWINPVDLVSSSFKCPVDIYCNLYLRHHSMG